MKYRIQFSCKLKQKNSNTLLNYIESIKDKIYVPNHYTPVYIKKCVDLYENIDDISFNNLIVSISQDSENVIHNFSSEELSYLVIDISFDNELDLSNLINIIIENKTVFEEVYQNRYFECRHDEQTLPLQKDGNYNYINL